MLTKVNIWSKINTKPTNSVKLFLHEQAELLGEVTNGVIKAVVETTLKEENKRHFRHDLFVYVPSLDFVELLLTVDHLTATDEYPVAIIEQLGHHVVATASFLNGNVEFKEHKNTGVQANNYDEFVDEITKLLESPNVVAYLNTLFSRSV